MLFSSITFLFVFLPIFLIIYYLVPFKLKNLILFVCSLLFYVWGETKYIWVLLTSTFVDFFVSKNLKKTENPTKRKLLLLISLTVNFSLLAYFKYSGFINDLLPFNIPVATHLPIGISFYTFQTLSYTIDVYRRNVEALDDFIDFGAYVTMFMQLIAGPIVRFVDVSKEIRERTIFNSDISNGWKRFVLGLSKKVLLANQMGLLFDRISLNTSWMGLDGWIGITAYALQIYYDFSGYSDMAIGLGQMLGFKFPNNFDNPYYATSITNFWRRWHMTLGTWFREYVYIPLGGNRTTFLKWTRNLLVVWGLTGLWHGASWNFVFWGLYYGILLWIEKVFFKGIDNKWYNHIYTIFFVLIGWVLFAFDDLNVLMINLENMFNFSTIISTVALYELKGFAILLIISLALCYPKVMEKSMKANDIICFVLFILCICYLLDGSYNPFLYFRF